MSRLQQETFKIFISHKLSDKELAELVVKELEALGGGRIDCWMSGQDLSAGVGNDGNYVSLDREAAKLAANQLRFDTVSAIVSAELKQLSFAASDGKG